MIFTLTLNPSLDRYLYVDELKEDDTMRVNKVEDYAAGKGIDVSRVIKEIGGTSVAICPLGGENGEKISFLLDDELVLYAGIRVKKETRMNVLVQTKEKQYRMSLPGPTLSDKEFSMITSMLDATLREGDTLVASGSLPLGFSPETYYEITNLAKSKGANVYVDSDGENLKAALRAHPTGIKPNIYELSRLAGKEIKNEAEILEVAKHISKEYGVKDVLITLGKEGAIALCEGKAYKLFPIDVEVLSAVGAGDAFLAGFVYKRNSSLDEALKFALAASTATVMTPGTMLCLKKDVDRLLKKAKISQIY
ncbi:1-phosphofructokinase family hexose kinase [Mesoaciditoga lauensis]|uniref:1-phosphofructokinase family hexose kinase n=1 Tax=Mesoaciditoga lauensis TaxID=1495039 RepID=UPI00056916A4|nr:1-phosphofructokinase family hexose kinase [Mesoaciditoga lauensis]